MKMVTAIIRTTALERIVKALETIGVRGLTISVVKGTGQEVSLFRPYTIHDRIEIIVPDEKADEVAKVIFDQAATGLAGDGIVAVHSLDYAVKIRTGEKMK